MATSSILQFCPTDTGTNLETDASYLAAADRIQGNQPGVARSKLVNKGLRQSSLLAAMVAKFTADRQASNVDDTLSIATLQSYFEAALLQFMSTQNSGVLTPSPGYIKIPITYLGNLRYFILQWGQTTLNPGVYSAVVTLPTSYPNGTLFATATDTGAQAFSGGAFNSSLSAITLYKQPSNPSTFAIQWLSAGF